MINSLLGRVVDSWQDMLRVVIIKEHQEGAISAKNSRQEGCNLTHRGVSKLTPLIHFEAIQVSIQKEGKLEPAVSLAMKPLRSQNESKESTF